MHDSNSSLSVDVEFIPSNALPYLQEFLLYTKVLCPIWVAIISFGLMANVINIIVFLKAGANNNVTILLLSLAVSDLVFLILITPVMCRFIFFTMAPWYRLPFDPSLLAFITYWPAFTAYDISAFISVSLGVMRCACVAMPLKFKLVFTTSRTVKWVTFLVVLAIALRIPVLTIHRLAWKTDPATNMSLAYLKHEGRVSMSRINDIMNRGFVIYFNYITMITCVIILTLKLSQASKIRRSCTTTSSDQKSTVDQMLSSKDIQVVKSVVLVCSIFIFSQALFLTTSSIRLLRPEFNSGRRLDFLFAIFSQTSATCAYLNASLNIFVYYNYNSKFRMVFNSLIFPKNKE